MSHDYSKGRADAAKGDFNPPKHDSFDGMFESKEKWESTQERRQEYREGYFDKKAEIKDNK